MSYYFPRELSKIIAEKETKRATGLTPRWRTLQTAIMNYLHAVETGRYDKADEFFDEMEEASKGMTLNGDKIQIK